MIKFLLIYDKQFILCIIHISYVFIHYILYDIHNNMHHQTPNSRNAINKKSVLESRHVRQYLNWFISPRSLAELEETVRDLSVFYTTLLATVISRCIFSNRYCTVAAYLKIK